MRLVGQIQTLGPSRQALKFLLMLRGRPIESAFGGDERADALEDSGPCRAIGPRQPLVVREVGPVGDREQLGEGPHGPAHRLRRDDFERHAGRVRS